MRFLAILLVLVTAASRTLAHAQDTAPLAARLEAVNARSGNGHSPTDEEVAAAGSFDPLPDGAAVTAALPALTLALANTDLPVRTFALTALAGLESAADPANPSAGPSSFKADVSSALTPAIPRIGAHLTEDSKTNRMLTAQVLGGFTGGPPALYPPLIAYLKRDDAIGPVGLAVVTDLLQVGPVDDATAAAITRYLHRSDQTASSRADLVEAIAARPSQNTKLNQALLAYLDGDDDALKARVILSLPALDLPPDVFATLKARMAAIAEGAQESLPVINAARSVAGCWTAVKMTSGCPVY